MTELEQKVNQAQRHEGENTQPLQKSLQWHRCAEDPEPCRVDLRPDDGPTRPRAGVTPAAPATTGGGTHVFHLNSPLSRLHGREERNQGPGDSRRLWL